MYEYKATVLKVIDGDTFDTSVDLGFHVMTKVRFRVFGIDTAELRTTLKEEKALALKAKARVSELILGKEVRIRTFKTDKYGRWLAEVDLGETSLSKLLLSEGLAVQYKE